MTSNISSNLIVLKATNHIKELQTVIMDKTSTRSDFIFHADRLIRMVVEESLNQLPYRKQTITTPTGQTYEGLAFEEGNCGVSVMRSGEAMESGLRECCRSIRIGKILVSRQEESGDAKVFYAKLPSDVADRKVLLMYPILYSGNSLLKALEVLLGSGVVASRVVVVTLFASQEGINRVFERYPTLKLLTSEVTQHPPIHFGHKYFGTE